MGEWAGGLGALGAEMCAPLLLLCWLCCWPDDSSDSSSEMPQKPIITVESTSHRRSNEFFGRRFASSAVSLHLPSTSGHTKQPLSAHRSHEEIRSRRKSHHEAADPEARYHSAPSVIDEVLHRRDWERSTKDLHIPLKPPDDPRGSTSSLSSEGSPDETSSVVERTDEQVVGRACKKHYTNIKSSRNTNLKEFNNADVKDQDATEAAGSSFYIGDVSCQLGGGECPARDGAGLDRVRAAPKAKEVKQCLNECIRSKDRPKMALVPVTEFQVSSAFDVDGADDIFVDRSGAVHHSVESRSSLFGTHAIPFPPPSVEAVGYESDASYLEEASAAGAAWAWRRAGAAPAGGGARPRHASVGDVVAPSLALRPQSGALSESDLDFDLEGCDEPPPAYDEVQLLASADRKETAI